MLISNFGKCQLRGLQASQACPHSKLTAGCPEWAASSKQCKLASLHTANVQYMPPLRA